MLARLDGFDAKSGRMRRKRYERRDDETRRCAAGRRFLFVAPFSVAHPCRQEKGIRLLFFLLSRLASCPLSRARIIRSYRIVSVPWKRCGGGVVALGDTPRRVGGVIWLLVSRPVPSSRSAARSISPYRLAGRMRAPFLSAHSPASFVGGWSYRFPFRLVPRLVCPSRGASRIYSLRFACRLVLLVNSPASYCPVSPGGSSLSLPVLFIVPWCLVFAFHLAGVSLFRLARSSRQAVRVLSFRPGVSSRRLVWRGGFSVSRLILFCSRIISLVRLMTMGTGGGSSCYCLVLWLCVSFPVAIRHR